MTTVAIPGSGFLFPFVLDSLQMIPALDTTEGLIDATGEKVAFSGPVWWSDRGSHDIHSLGWLAGAITSAGGSGITISLQDVTTASGPPGRPDETQDQTVNVLLSALTASGWNVNTLGVDRTIAHGALVSVVWEYDGSGRLGSDSLVIAGAETSFTRGGIRTSSALKVGTWANVNLHPIVVLVAADGTIGTLAGGVPWSAVNTHTFDTGAAADELAIAVNLPFPVTIEGVSIPIAALAGGNFSVILYSGTTAVETAAVTWATMVGLSSEARWRYVPFTTPRALEKNTLYRVAIRPDTANDITVYSFDVNTAGYLDLWGGQNFHYWDRANAGAWANETTTRCLLMRLHLSHVDDGAGGGGGGVIGGLRRRR